MHELGEGALKPSWLLLTLVQEEEEEEEEETEGIERRRTMSGRDARTTR